MFYFSPENGFQTVELHGGEIPPEAVPVTPKQHRDLMIAQQRGCTFAVKGGQVVAVEPPRPSRDKIKKEYSRYTTVMVDTMAKTFGFDDARDILSFVDDPNPTYDKQARDFRIWRSSVWTEFDRRFNYEHPESTEVQDIQNWVNSLPGWPEEDGADEAQVAARTEAAKSTVSYQTGEVTTAAEPEQLQAQVVTEAVENNAVAKAPLVTDDETDDDIQIEVVTDTEPNPDPDPDQHTNKE